MLKNTPQTYGSVSKFFHWLLTVLIIGLFILGLWMMELTYYDAWYQKAPHYHKSIGILVALAMVLRLLWRWTNPKPRAIVSHKTWEVWLSAMMQWLLYLLIFMVLITGYLIPTGDGRGIDVFNWFTVPSLGALIEQQEDFAGAIHYWLAIGVMVLAGIHALAALKHHFLDKDATLKRML